MRVVIILYVFLCGMSQAFSSDSHFDYLPAEIKIKIFKKLDLEDIFRMRRVSKEWKHLSFDRDLWQAKPFSAIQYRISPNHILKELERNKSINHLNLKNAGAIFQTKKNSIMGVLKSIFNFILSYEGAVKNQKYQQLVCANFNNCFELDREFLKNIIKHAPNLRELYLQNTHLENISFNDLPIYLKNLRYLDVKNNTRFCDQNIMTITQYCRKLETINLRGCKALTDNALICLKMLPKLINVGLGETYFSNESIMFFLMSKKDLNYLDLKGYSDVEGWEISSVIGEYCKDLTILVLSDSDSLSRVKFNTLKSLSKLEKLDLSYPKIPYELENKNWPPLDQLIACVPQINALKISGTDVTDFEIVYILENCPNLRQLYPS